MKPTLIGKLTILILLVGLAFGGWRFLRSNAPAPAGDSGSGKTSSGGGTSANSGGGGSGGGEDIQIITSATAKTWLQAEIDRFQSSNGGKWHVTPKYIETREAMHAILEGSEKPVIWGPSSPVWAVRLGEAWKSQHQTGSVVDTSDPDSTRVFLRSPIVFLTTREKAPFLRPLLGGGQAWASIRSISLGKIKAPWSRLRWAHADPLKANSGMLTLSLILSAYAQQNGGSAPLDAVAESGGFTSFLQELESSLVYDLPVQQGSSVLTRAFVDDPSRYDFITTYESSALAAAADHPDLVVIYPNPTAVAEHSLVVLNADWISPQQREGAVAFMKFLAGPESMQEGVKNYLRPAVAGSSFSLDEELSKRQGQGFQRSFSSQDLPPYAALNSAAFQWRIHVAKQPAGKGDFS